MKKRTLPKRFWTQSEYLDGEKFFVQPRRHPDTQKCIDYYIHSIHPILREMGFSCKGFSAYRETESISQVVHCKLVESRGTVTISFYANLKGLTAGQTLNPNQETSGTPYSDYMFQRYFRLENGQHIIDAGWDEDSARETCDIIATRISDQVNHYFSQFDDIVESLLAFQPHSFRMEDFREATNRYGLVGNLSDSELLVWLANFHQHYGAYESAISYLALSREKMSKRAHPDGPEPRARINQTPSK